MRSECTGGLAKLVGRKLACHGVLGVQLVSHEAPSLRSTNSCAECMWVTGTIGQVDWPLVNVSKSPFSWAIEK
jgi:hypothetical protein